MTPRWDEYRATFPTAWTPFLEDFWHLTMLWTKYELCFKPLHLYVVWLKSRSMWIVIWWIKAFEKPELAPAHCSIPELPWLWFALKNWFRQIEYMFYICVPYSGYLSSNLNFHEDTSCSHVFMIAVLSRRKPPHLQRQLQWKCVHAKWCSFKSKVELARSPHHYLLLHQVLCLSRERQEYYHCGQIIIHRTNRFSFT